MASIISAGTTSGTSLNLSGDTSGVLQLASNGSTTAVTINTSQNVGVGIASPTARLHVYGGSNNQFKVESSGAEANFTLAGTSYGQINNSVGDWYLTNDASANMIFRTASTERMRITSAGTVLLGTTSTSSFDGGFRAVPTGSGNSMQVIISNTGGGLPFLINRSDDGNIIDFRRAGSNVGTISVTTTNTAYNTSSDYRLKENIAPMTGALAKITQLKPVTYTWKSTGKTSQGFIAHELQAVVPDCVTGEKDAVDEEGNPVHQGVDTSYLVATLTSAIQELNAKVEAQAVRIAELEGAK